MNARVKAAVFMPIFATTTAEGPASPGQLIQQMHAAGMTAGAWMVEGMLERLTLLEDLAGGLEIESLSEIKGMAHELSNGLGDVAGKLEGLAERLGMALNRDELEAESEKAGFLADDAQRLASTAEEIYDTIDNG